MNPPNVEMLPIPSIEDPRKHVTEDQNLKQTGDDIVPDPFISYIWKLRPWEGPEPS